MDLYVANCTQQGHIFTYKVPEYPNPFMVPIPQGGQVKVPAPAGGFNVHQINYIVDHYSKYGLRSADELDRASFVGLCYSIDRPVALGQIQKTVERNLAVLTDQGRKNREEAAIAADSQIADAYRGSGIAIPAASEFTFDEVKTRSNPSPEMGEQKIRVSRDGAPPVKRPRGRRAA